MNLSVGIITYNEERDLSVTLNAVKDIADEIVIVDSGSTDRTPEIAQSFGAKFFVEEWKGFGKQKNSVIDKCQGRWILLIDADEEVSPSLKEEIRKVISKEKNEVKVYKLNFTTFCFGREIRYGGWSNFYRIRLFEKGSGKYDDREVHENFISSGPIGMIREKICHHTYYDLNDYLSKFNEYTSKSAKHYYQDGKKKSVLSAYFSSCFHFFKTYFIQLGFLDGYEGFLLSKLSAMTVLIKYSKLRELYRQKKNI